MKPWLKAVVLSTGLIFVAVAVYVYGFRFIEWLESDAAVTVVLASKAIDATRPVVDSWYYANGDLWFFYYHLVAILPVLVLGLGVPALLVTAVTTFALELAVFAKLYLRLAGDRWVAVLAAMVTLTAWSNAHVAYNHIQLAYGFITCLCVVSFTWVATVAQRPVVGRATWPAVAAWIAVVGAQNPLRVLVFIVAPVIVCCVWPWHHLAQRRRIALAGIAVAGWVVAFLVYHQVLSRFVTFSIPHGHTGFALANADELARNLRYLGHGLLILCGAGSEPSPLAIPGALVMLGALALLVREVFASRTLNPLRFVCIAVFAQLGATFVLVLVGNLLTDPASVRYLMPGLLAALGLATILAVRALTHAGALWRKLATAWLVALPVTAAIAARDARPPTPTQIAWSVRQDVWPDPVEADRIASEVVKRGLTRGYSNALTATLMTVQSGGAAQICSIYFRDFMVPQRWLTDTHCYDKDKLPARFFVVLDRTAEHDREALAASLPPASETFSVGPLYEVHVFETAKVPLLWLDLPLPENDRSAFPMHIPANHLQLKRGKATPDGDRMVATGETGPILYGPYVTLPRGRYTVRWYGSGVASPGEIKFYVAAGGSEKLAESGVLAAKIPATRGELGSLVFKLKASRPAIELVIYSQDGGRVAVDEIVVERR